MNRQLSSAPLDLADRPARIALGIRPSASSDETASLIVPRKTLKRETVLEFLAKRLPAMVAMEAASGAHHWARELRALSHDARIVDPRLVAPYTCGRLS